MARTKQQDRRSLVPLTELDQKIIRAALSPSVEDLGPGMSADEAGAFLRLKALLRPSQIASQELWPTDRGECWLLALASPHALMRTESANEIRAVVESLAEFDTTKSQGYLIKVVAAAIEWFEAAGAVPPLAPKAGAA